MFRSWSLKKKLFISFLATAILLSVVGIAGSLSVEGVSNQYETVATRNLPNALSIAALRNAVRNSLSDLLQLSLEGNDQKEVERLVGKVNSAIADFENLKQEYSANIVEPEERKLFEDLVQAWNVVKGHVEKNLILAQSDKATDRLTFANAYREEFKDARHVLYASMDKLIAYQRSSSSDAVHAARSVAAQARWLTTFLVLFGSIGSLVLGFVIAARLSKTLSDVAQQLMSGVKNVSHAATQVHQASESLSSSTTEQASALQETSSSVQELSSMVKRNAESASQSQELSQASSQTAVRGQEAVGEMMKAIDEISDSNDRIVNSIENSNRNMEEISKVIQEISSKTRVINDIVFQTRLLSFNASVEAARAGEQGKGFAVVAEEVGNLAQMSGQAANEISQMLTSSVSRVENIVKETREDVEKFIHLAKQRLESGKETASRCGNVLNEVVNNVANVNGIVGEIATASREQSTGLEAITTAMHQLDRSTQQNASVSEQTAGAASELAQQAKSLNDAAAELMEAVQGHSHGATQNVSREHVYQESSHRLGSVDRSGIQAWKKGA